MVENVEALSVAQHIPGLVVLLCTCFDLFEVPSHIDDAPAGEQQPQHTLQEDVMGQHAEFLFCQPEVCAVLRS